MTARILDGKRAAQCMQERTVAAVSKCTQKWGRVPCLAVVLVGDDPASEIYVRAKSNACMQVGMRSLRYDFPKHASQADLCAYVDTLAQDPAVDGILVQLPLPSHMDTEQVLQHIPAYKDVDGFHPYNLGKLAQRQPTLRCCTPYGVMQLLAYAGFKDLANVHAVVVGVSNHVGRPMLLELLLAKCTVTACHRFTPRLDERVALADLLIVATGKRQVVQAAWIKPGAIVVDIGIHRMPNGTLSGDLDFEQAKARAGWITPVPGGVGPMTIAVLLQNTYLAFKMAMSKKQNRHLALTTGRTQKYKN